MADDLVRVRLENGNEATVSAALAESAGLKPLDEPATDYLGNVLPTTRANGRPDKPKTSPAKAAAKKTPAKKAATTQADSPAAPAEEANA